MKKQTKKQEKNETTMIPEVVDAVPAGTPAALSPEINDKAESLITEINRCLEASVRGQVMRLKAGLGILCVRELIPHGGWAEYLAGRFPQKSYRTVTRYANEATAFCAGANVKATAAWDAMSGAGADVKLLGTGKEKPTGILRKVGDFLFGDKPKAEPKQLTAAQRANAQLTEAFQGAITLRDWTESGLCGAKDRRDLEPIVNNLSLALRAAKDKLAEMPEEDAPENKE